ncbi:MAG: toprim domain-containing protein [Deltaproteobacteria bacterium]|nr:toprim domain-containing protein [Deltaproteobacteria bacterium]
MKITPETLSDIRGTVNVRALVEALGLRVAREKPSGEIWLHSPFSPDKTASMHIQSDGRWKDFSSGKGGGAIELYQQIRGCDCYTAGREMLELGLCNASIETPRLPRTHEPRMEAKEPLPERPSLVPYLQPHEEYERRSISERTRLELGFGYLPSSNKAKLAGRHVFQIKDEAGRVVSHIGRAVDQRQAESKGKWRVYGGFSKSCFLYGHHLLAEGKTKVDAVKNGLIVVEGCFDAVKLHEAGIPSVATFGANLSEAQARKLVDLHQTLHLPRVVIWFDRDPAGFEATERALAALKKAGVPAYPFDWQAAAQEGLVPPEVNDACDISVDNLRRLHDRGLI